MPPVVAPTAGILIRDRIGNDVFGTNSFCLASVEDTYEAGDEMTGRHGLLVRLRVERHLKMVASGRRPGGEHP